MNTKELFTDCRRVLLPALVALVALAAILPSTPSAYSDVSLTVKISPLEDGTAHVSEQTLVALNTADEIQAFDYTIQTASALVDWRKYSTNVAYHTRGTITNLHVTGKRDYTAGSVGTIVLDYDLNNTVARREAQGSRVMRFTFDPSTLAFDSNAANETILKRGTELHVQLPAGATLVDAHPKPDTVDGKLVVWRGPVTSTWSLVYEVEKPLSTEVNEFFLQAYEQGLGLVPIVLLLVLAAFFGLKIIQARK